MDFNIGNKQVIKDENDIDISKPNNNIQLPPPNNVFISYPKKQGHVMITWNSISHPNNNDEDNNNDFIVNYNVYRGTSVNGIFYKLNDEPIKNNYFEDEKQNKNPNITYWYKVSSIYKNDSGNIIEGKSSKPIKYEVNNTNRWFKKMNERSMWILKNTGQLFDLYVRKYEGKRCPKCYDSIRGRSGNGHCEICFGTGFEDGYEPMFQLYMRLKPVQQSLDIGSHGFQINSSPGAWTISSTQIKNRDILIGPQGIIYSVTSSHINQAAGYLFHQELQLKELERTDPLYNLKRETLYPIY
ncbi:MAG: hypothetical protein ACOCRK_01415 [bacterium]